MSKRYGKKIDNSQLKKPRLDIIKTDKPIKSGRSSLAAESDDVWGEDFAEDEVEKLDIIASQACSQEVNISTVNINIPESSHAIRQDHVFTMPSTSTGSYTSCNISKINSNNSQLNPVRYYPQQNPSLTCQKFNQEQQASQKLASSDNIRGIAEDDINIDEFKKNLMVKGNLNSTFRSTQDNGNAHETIEDKLYKLNKLEDDYKKLLNDFTLKEGETIFLRQQLQRTQIKAEKENIEKVKLIEEQASNFRSEINTLYKEKENMKTQFQLQTLQMNNIMERCKILEKGTIKFAHPQSNYLSDSPKNRTLDTPSRVQSSISRVKMCETSIQTEKINHDLFQLKSTIIHYPFKKMPQAIFESSMTEKSIVDIENIEKRGKRIVPILEDEETFRIFENSDIVKPKVTTINDKTLSVEFFQSDIASIMNKTESELNSMEVIVIINKIVATARELMLNIVSVLQTITALLNNDDIRNMNDLYLSNFYDMPMNYNQTLCDANEWHEMERGIEARRSLGVLSYIAKESNYLCKYIVGKCELNIENDEAYSNYSQQMIRYSEWSTLKQHKYEILEIILQFVTALNYVRRAHQFTGLICAMLKILKIVQNKIGFDDKGLNYIAKIFKELIFSRPLPRCLISMTEMMTEFSQLQIFINHIIIEPKETPFTILKNVLTFSDNACVLEIYIEQLKNFRFDDIAMINIAHALMLFADIGYRSEIIPWPYERTNDYDCSTALLIFIITSLYKCAKINVNSVKTKYNIKQKYKKIPQYLDNNFWLKLKNKQFNLLKMGIRFLSYLAKRDPEVIIKSVDLENAFPLFMEYISSVDGLKLHEVEEEAIMIIKSTFAFDKPPLSMNVTRDGSKLFDIMSAFDKKLMPTPVSGKWFHFDGNRDEYRVMTQMFESKLQL